MKIGLIDVDGHNFPNLPLMKISAYHKSQGDSVEWYQPLFTGHCDIVYMSKVFSFTQDYEYPVDATKIFRGGSGYCIKTVNGIEVYDKAKDNPLPDEIEHIYLDYSLYGITDTAYGFLTRGCPRKCNFCHVKNKEGTKSIKVANLSEFWRGQKNIVLCDPNILACSERLDLLQQLVESKARVDFNQGLDVRLMDSHVLEKLRRIKVKSIHIAYDRIEQKDIIEPKMRMLKEMTGYGRNKVSVYILCNFDTTVEQDMHRIQFCRQLNFQPYPMIYDKQHADPIYRKIQRWCSPFIFWKTQSFNEYTRL